MPISTGGAHSFFAKVAHGQMAVGLRVSFGGPPDAQGRRLRFVFGIAASPGNEASRDRPTNVTVIVGGPGPALRHAG